MNDHKERKLITAKLESDVHIAAAILAKRYKNQNKLPGRVSLSTALRLFITQHDPELANAAQKQADEQDTLSSADD